MIYSGTGVAEFINVNDRGKDYIIMLDKMPDKSTFVVLCDYDDNWGYEFYMENNTSYEQVKFNIMSEIFECETMYELLTHLSEIFEDGFADIIVEAECECNCENCKCDCE